MIAKSDTKFRRALLAAALDNQGVNLVAVNRFDEAKKILDESYRTRAEVFGDQSYDTGSSCFHIAELYARSNQPQQALEWYRKSLEIFTTVCPDQYHVIVPMLGSAKAYVMLKDYQIALGLLQTCLKTAREKFPGRIYGIGECLVQLGLVYHALGNNSESIKYMEEAKTVFTSKNVKSLEFLAIINHTLDLIAKGPPESR